MTPVCLFALAFLAAALVDGAVTPLADPLVPVSTIEDTVKNLRTKLGSTSVPERTVEDPLGLFRVDLSGGKFGDLSSLSLRGYNQRIDKSTSDKGISLRYEARIGLDDLQVSYGYSYRYLYFLRGTGNLRLGGNKELAVRVKGFVNQTKKGNCYGFIQEAEIVNFGKFETIEADNLVLKWYSRFVMNIVIPFSKPIVNEYLQLQIDYKIPQTNFSSLICESLPEGLLTSD